MARSNKQREMVSVVQGQTKSTGKICKVDTRPENQTQFKKNAENNKMKWLEVRAEVTKITQERLKQLSPTGDCQLSKDQKSYIKSLTDPQVTVVVCQGGAGTGKTYTTMLTACIAV
jgi:predicted ribonuclease YlaK